MTTINLIGLCNQYFNNRVFLEIPYSKSQLDSHMKAGYGELHSFHFILLILNSKLYKSQTIKDAETKQNKQVSGINWNGFDIDDI